MLLYAGTGLRKRKKGDEETRVCCCFSSNFSPRVDQALGQLD
jgi:hypothetical protein